MERERLGSRLGFILLSAGCAIGCGNVWKFPWMCGQYGGGGFVLIYILCLLLLGLPVMTMEFAVGRAAQASPIHMYQKLERKGQKWHLHGYIAFFGNIAPHGVLYRRHRLDHLLLRQIPDRPDGRPRLRHHDHQSRRQCDVSGRDGHCGLRHSVL